MTSNFLVCQINELKCETANQKRALEHEASTLTLLDQLDYLLFRRQSAFGSVPFAGFLGQAAKERGRAQRLGALWLLSCWFGSHVPFRDLCLGGLQVMDRLATLEDKVPTSIAIASEGSDLHCQLVRQRGLRMTNTIPPTRHLAILCGLKIKYGVPVVHLAPSNHFTVLVPGQVYKLFRYVEEHHKTEEDYGVFGRVPSHMCRSKCHCFSCKGIPRARVSIECLSFSSMKCLFEGPFYSDRCLQVAGCLGMQACVIL